MKSKNNKDADIDKKVLCVGCSWNRHWPNFINRVAQVQWEGYCGKGLEHLSSVLRTAGDVHDYIILQLPTPIRSVDKKNGQKTLKLLFDFVSSFKAVGERKARKLLLSYYRDKLVTIDEESKSKVIFFLYNVGGYPFRCPFDFGKDIDIEFIKFFKKNNLNYVYLSFEGVTGYGMKEVQTEPALEQHIVHPSNSFIVDPHPNEAADKRAALIIEDYIYGKENASS